MSGTDRRVTLAVAGVLVAVAALYLLTLRDGQRWASDFSMYIAHARNLAEGVPYDRTGYVFNPDYGTVGPPTYPPGYPLLLAPIYAVAGMDLHAMKVQTVIFFVAALGVLAAWARPFLPGPYLVAMVALIGFSPSYWSYKDHILSDVPFLFFLALFLLAERRGREAAMPAARAPGRGRIVLAGAEAPAAAGASARRAVSWGLLAGFALAAATATRTLGILLLPALWATELLRAAWPGHPERHALGWRPSPSALAATASFGVLFALQMWLLPYGWGYGFLTAELAAVPGRVVEFGTLVLQSWAGRPLVALLVALVLAAGAVGVLGFATRLARGPAPAEPFAVAYALALFLFITPSRRYFVPLLPLALFYGLVGLAVLERRWRRLVRPAFAAGLLLAAVAYGAGYARADYGPLAPNPFDAAARELYGFIREETPEDAVLLFREPRALALFTGRRASMWHTAEPAALRAYMDRIGSEWVVMGPIGAEFPDRYWEELGAALAAGDDFERVLDAPMFEVYRRRTER